MTKTQTKQSFRFRYEIFYEKTKKTCEIDVAENIRKKNLFSKENFIDGN